MLLFVGWRYYLSFMPVVVGVIVHSVAEHVREHRHLLRERSRLQERNESLQLEVEKLRTPVEKSCLTSPAPSSLEGERS
jgi:hypothetical protein